MAIDPDRHFKRRAGPNTAPLSSIPWVDDSGNAVNFKCPECGLIFTYDHNDKCKWTPDKLTPQERGEIERRDPEMIPVLCYLEKIKRSVPSFDRNLRIVSGKERRMKRFLSKCSR
jgi:hypothetical protein